MIEANDEIDSLLLQVEHVVALPIVETNYVFAIVLRYIVETVVPDKYMSAMLTART